MWLTIGIIAIVILVILAIVLLFALDGWGGILELLCELLDGF